MFGIDDALIGGAAGLLGGLFSSPKGNPNDWALQQAQQYQQQGQQFLDPNNQFYKTAQQNYFTGLNRQLGAAQPTTQSLLSAQVAGGGQFGGSMYTAGKQAQAQTQKATDAAGQSTQQFGANLYQQGLGAYENMQSLASQMYGLYGQGKMAQYQSKGNMSSQLMNVGGGLLGRYFGGQQGDGVSNSFSPTSSFGGGSGNMGVGLPSGTFQSLTNKQFGF